MKRNLKKEIIERALYSISYTQKELADLQTKNDENCINEIEHCISITQDLVNKLKRMA